MLFLLKKPLRTLLVGCALAGLSVGAIAAEAAAPVTFVFTSDVHFGLARGRFRGGSYVDAAIVDRAMVAKINRISDATLPADGGLRAGEPVGPVDFVAITGDLTNRQELYPAHIQSAAKSWAQFQAVFIEGLTLKNKTGEPTALYYVPGNHDVSNAIGAPTKLLPATDATSLTEIYNRMMKPAVPLTPQTYNYAKDRINYSRDIGGAHLVFITMWPDSIERAWLDQDLAHVPAQTPVFIFCHDPPAVDARHFINPKGDHGINSADLYENLLADPYADGVETKASGKPDGPTTIEQRALAAFLRRHPNIVGYFHGHDNYNEVYTWKGPDGDLSLNVFRVDSPMKGKTGKDETKVSFQVVVYDVASHRLTDRECLWNSRGANDGDEVPVSWGESSTVSIRVP